MPAMNAKAVHHAECLSRKVYGEAVIRQWMTTQHLLQNLRIGLCKGPALNKLLVRKCICVVDVRKQG